MSDTIGHVKSPKGMRYEVSYDDRGDVYVKEAGGLSFGASWTKVGRASSPSDAMRRAEAFVYNK